MYINKGNYQKALKELKNNENNAVSEIINDLNDKNGLLKNVVITIKDNFATKNFPTKASCQFLKNFHPSYNADVVEKIEKNGGLIIAKVHLDELSLGGTGEFSSFGLIKNPLNKSKKAGGSSSGSVATMTKNIGAAIGSDTGNSIRLPASYCAFVGFKPSYGAVSRYGLFPFASSLDTVAWITHNVNDAIQVASVLFEKSDHDFTSLSIEKPITILKKPNKIAFFDFSEFLDQKVNDDFKKIIKKIESYNIKVIKIDIDQKLFELIPIVYNIISYSESSSNYSNLSGINFGKREKGKNWDEIVINSRSKNLGNMVQRRFILGSLFLLKENQKDVFIKAQKIRRLLSQKINDIFSQYDYVIFPSANEAPSFDKNLKITWFDDFLALANLNGHPSISIPFTKGMNDMPIGLSIEAKKYEDKNLLATSLWIEKIIKEVFNE